MVLYDASVTSTWKEAAACRGAAAEVFYPETEVAARLAKAICASCVVRGTCLQVALRNRERHGVWGGMTERERARLRRRGLHAA